MPAVLKRVKTASQEELGVVSVLLACVEDMISEEEWCAVNAHSEMRPNGKLSGLCPNTFLCVCFEIATLVLWSVYFYEYGQFINIFTLK